MAGGTIRRGDVLSFVRDLAIIDLDAPPVFDMLANRLQLLLRTECSLVFSWRADESGTSLDRLAICGRGHAIEKELATGLDQWMQRSAGAFAFYDPRGPEPAQRNVALEVGSWRALAEDDLPERLARAHLSKDERKRRVESVAGARSIFRRWGTIDAEQMRALVCEGPVCHAWVGALQHEAFDPDARRILQKLVPALRRRLAVDARLRGHEPAALVPALLEEIATAAYVLDVHGRIAAMNVLGNRAVLADGARRRERIARARGGSDPGFVAVALASRGAPGYSLIIERAPANLPSGAPARVASRFGLTRRETDVVEQLALGRTNRAIGARLGCSERTVETHVRRILGKTDCASRAEVVSLVWATATG